METRLYVGNLSYSATEDELLALFEKAGKVKSVAVVRDRDTGQSRGFGFVEMETAAEAQQAVSSLNGSSLGGRTITVNIARPREERPSGGGFGRPGGGPGGGGRRSGPRDRRY